VDTTTNNNTEIRIFINFIDKTKRRRLVKRSHLLPMKYEKKPKKRLNDFLSKINISYYYLNFSVKE